MQEKNMGHICPIGRSGVNNTYTLLHTHTHTSHWIYRLASFTGYILFFSIVIQQIYLIIVINHMLFLLLLYANNIYIFKSHIIIEIIAFP